MISYLKNSPTTQSDIYKLNDSSSQRIAKFFIVFDLASLPTFGDCKLENEMELIRNKIVNPILN